MAGMQGEISDVVEDTVVETFNGMLGQKVVTAAVQRPAEPGPEHKVYACLLLDQEKDVSANFCFSFDDQLLSMTAANFYPGDEAAKPSVREDIACAVANIVGSKVRTFLNKHGYNFEMTIPFVAEPGAGTELKRDGTIHVHFSYDDNQGRSSDDGVVVNFMLEGHKAGNC